MSEPTVYISDDPAAAVGELLAVEARRGSAIALTGGSDPGPAYAHAASLEPDWSGASLWWSDERCVPPDDPLTNYNIASEFLLDRLDGLPEVHRIRGELPPAEAAAEYNELLGDRQLDFALLGLGPDGHIASLFPGSPQLLERSVRVTSGPAGLEPFVDRVTMTLPTLLAAGRIVFLVSGPHKADAVAWSFRNEPSDAVPASLLRRGTVPIDVYLDAHAAAQLDL